MSNEQDDNIVVEGGAAASTIAKPWTCNKDHATDNTTVLDDPEETFTSAFQTAPSEESIEPDDAELHELAADLVSSEPAAGLEENVETTKMAAASNQSAADVPPVYDDAGAGTNKKGNGDYSCDKTTAAVPTLELLLLCLRTTMSV